MLRLVFSIAVLASALTGCSDQLPTYPVVGKVEFENGRPVVVGVVEFQSVEHAINARGEIEPDGTFQLTTFEDGDGAVAGEHNCVVLQMVIGENLQGHVPSVIGVVDPVYGSYLSSGLTCTVEPDGANEVTLRVRGVRKQLEPGAPHTHE